MRKANPSSSPAELQTVQIAVLAAKPFWHDAANLFKEYISGRYARSLAEICGPIEIDGASVNQKGPFSLGLYAVQTEDSRALDQKMAGLTMLVPSFPGGCAPVPDAEGFSLFRRADLEQAFPAVREALRHIPA